jgi:quinol monooxygenase YgiN
MTVQPVHEAAFVAACRELERYVQAHEPDTLFYQFFKLREPNRYAFIESFRDQAAEQRHMASATLAEIGPRIAACLDGTWELEYFDPVG